MSKGIRILRDSLLRASVVVDDGSELWLVPRAPEGWRRRQRLSMTPEARQKRLTPVRGVDHAWLGIPMQEASA